MIPLLLFVSACAGGSDGACRLEKLADLPIVIAFNVPIVAVEINGRPAAFVLDTGSNRSVLTRAAARRLGVTETNSREQVRGAGGVAALGGAVLKEVSLGPIRLGRLPVLTSNSPAPPLDGLLGIDLLVDYEMELDVPHRRMALYRARSCPTAMPNWPVPSVRLAVQVQPGSGHLIVPLEVDGQPLRGLLDSGASLSTLSLQAAADTGLQRRAIAALPRLQGQSINPDGIVIQQTRFKRLQIGADVIDNPRLTIADLPPFAGDMLIGEDYLGTRRVWFSFRLGQVFVASE